MKITCYGCRALEGSPQSWGGGYRCTLGYRIDPHGASGPIPLVECPKPRTVAGLCWWIDMKQANGGHAPRFEPGIDKREGSH